MSSAITRRILLVSGLVAGLIVTGCSDNTEPDHDAPDTDARDTDARDTDPRDTDPRDAEVKADFELVQKIDSRRAWEVFLKTHPKGPYADQARERIAAIDRGQGVGGSLSPPSK